MWIILWHEYQLAQYQSHRPQILPHIWDFSSIFIAQHAEILPTRIRSVEVVCDASYEREGRRVWRERYAEKGESSHGVIATTELKTKKKSQ
jgi:hypothetical protein